MKATLPCPKPLPSSCPSPTAGGLVRWALSATAAAALSACGGGGGGEPNVPANEAPTVSIDTPAANATFALGTSIRIAATAADRDGRVVRVEFYDGSTKLGEDTNAPFEFVWTTPPAGAHTITVRAVDNVGAVALSSSLPVSVSSAPPAPTPPSPPPPSPPPPAPNQSPTVAITSPVNNFKPNAPATVALVANAADADGTVSKVEFYRVNPAAPVFDSSTLLGQATALGTPPSYQLQTAPMTAGTYTFVARATDNAGAIGTAASVQVNVNALPSISITSPAPSASILIGTVVTLRATASDADGSVNRVEFFLHNSTTPLGLGIRVGTTNEYTLSWTAPTTQGTYSFTARATDNDGAVQSTASVSVNVPANVAPTVALDDPAAGTNAPTNMTLTASAADSDGTVVSVQFFNGASFLGNGAFDAATSKYRLVVAIGAAQSGTYTITARATDNLGGQRSTASRSVTIAPNVPPTVAMSSPAVFNLPAPVVLSANASDSDGIAKVEFLQGGVSLGETTTPPYQLTWAGVAAGAYGVSARATDNVGSITTSAAQTVTVVAASTDPMTMSCADGAGMQCSGEILLRTSNGIALSRSGVQAYGRSTSDLLVPNPSATGAFGFGLANGGTAELRVRKDVNALPTSAALLLKNMGISWDGRTNRPPIIETFSPTAGRVQLATNGSIVFGAVPPSSDLSYYDFANLGTGGTQLNYAYNRYFPRAEPSRCPPGDACPTYETNGPRVESGSWRSGGNEPDLLSVMRRHGDGDIHAGNGLPDGNGNPTWLSGGSGIGVPMPGSKGYRNLEQWSYRYANLASWFTDDTVNIAEWGGGDEHTKNRRGYVAYGDVSDPTSVPTSGSATYIGVVRGWYAARDSDEPVRFLGRVTVTANFVTRILSVSIEDTVLDGGTGAPVPITLTATVPMSNGADANYFTGPAGNAGLSGGVGGRYFGPPAAGGSGNGPAEIGGVFSLNGLGTDSVVSGFIARKQ